MYPDKTHQKRHKRIDYRMYRAVANYINDQLTVCAISGTLAAITVAIIALVTNDPVMNLAIPMGVILFIWNDSDVWCRSSWWGSFGDDFSV